MGESNKFESITSCCTHKLNCLAPVQGF